jgi:hypothetical protein
MNVNEAQPVTPKPTLRWFHFTPDRCLAGLLATEVFLLLSEQFHWFPKGWTVLIAVAAAVVTILFLLLWFAASLLCRWRFRVRIRSLLLILFGLLGLQGFLLLSERFRWLDCNEKMRWTVLIAVAAIVLAVPFTLFLFAAVRLYRGRFQFGIRSFLLLVVAVAIPCGWLTTEIRQAREQREASEGLCPWVLYDYEVDESRREVFGGRPRQPKWLLELFGIEFFADYVWVVPWGPRRGINLEHIEGLPKLHLLDLAGMRVTDAELVHLRGLTQLRQLYLDGTLVTDAGLENFETLGELQTLCLRETQVTDAGVKKLQQVLPNCKIER